MKSDVNRGRFYIECSCRSTDHILVIESYDYIPDDTKPEEKVSADVAFYFSGDYHAPWYSRIRIALAYVFRKRKFCWGDTVIVNDTNIKQLEEVVDYFKGRRKELREEDIFKLRKELKALDPKYNLDCCSDEYNFDDSQILYTMRDLVNTIKDLEKENKKLSENEKV
jgi:hypothetical protein